ncbi:hypothetical protein [Halospina sp. K52047b]|uniref:hypothetical protein n=1 Tax=Halospina sp. K52047b TaxID=2614160 RepID=UPI00124AB2F1|nr:hypothetical protein [Halospina sp. K52047b]KAA8985472.1 hypothetical protein F3089_02040 [Halospina sp. K52047b]
MIILHSLGLFGVDGRKRPSATGMITRSLALARKQDRKRQREAFWEVHRQKAVIGLVGFGLAGTVGYYAVGDVFPWNMFGLGAGFALATVCRELGIPINQ